MFSVYVLFYCFLFHNFLFWFEALVYWGSIVHARLQGFVSLKWVEINQLVLGFRKRSFSPGYLLNCFEAKLLQLSSHLFNLNSFIFGNLSQLLNFKSIQFWDLCLQFLYLLTQFTVIYRFTDCFLVSLIYNSPANSFCNRLCWKSLLICSLSFQVWFIGLVSLLLAKSYAF